MVLISYKRFLQHQNWPAYAPSFSLEVRAAPPEICRDLNTQEYVESLLIFARKFLQRVPQPSLSNLSSEPRASSELSEIESINCDPRGKEEQRRDAFVEPALVPLGVSKLNCIE